MAWGQDVTAVEQRQIFAGHTDRIYSLTCAQPGVLLSGSSDKTLRIWDTATGECKQSVSNYRGGVLSVLATPEKVYCGGGDHAVTVWDANTYAYDTSAEGHEGNVWALAQGSGMLFSGSTDATIKAWDLKTMKCVRTLAGHVSQVDHLLVHKNLLFSASWDKTIKVWDLDTFRSLATIRAHHGRVHALVLARDHLFSASSDHSIKVWDLNNYACKQVFQHSVSGDLPVMKSMVNCDGRIAVGGDDGYVTLIDLERMSTHILAGHSAQVEALAYDGETLYSGAYDNLIMSWR